MVRILEHSGGGGGGVTVHVSSILNVKLTALLHAKYFTKQEAQLLQR